jgi:hypothetical protein
MACQMKICHYLRMAEKTEYELECEKDKHEYELRRFMEFHEANKKVSRWRLFFELLVVIGLLAALSDFASDVIASLKNP